MKNSKENLNKTENNVEINNNKKKKIKLWVVILIVCLLIVGGIVVYIKISKTQCTENEHPDFYYNPNYPMSDKPIIYLYPEEKTKISVILGNPEKLTCIYPEYTNGWTITAYPDGTLIDEETGREYYSLYYECNNTKTYETNLEEGFVIEKENIVNFLEQKLAILGLNDKEIEEFIIYWLPKLQQHKYIYVRFQTIEEIEENMPLLINQTPDTLIRIMMEWKGLNEYIDIKEQKLNSVTRTGFTVVEWGGTEIK